MKALFVLVFSICFASLVFAQAPLVAPEGALAFPTAAAGISAYVKTDQKIVITDALANAFYKIEDVSDNHILGIVEVETIVSKVYPHVYVDTEGWMVAFFLAAEPPALIMQWSGDLNTPNAAIKTTLEVALEQIAKAARIPLPSVSFYDFNHPSANTMLILLRILPSPDKKNMYIKLPANYTLYSVSYFHYGCNFYVWPNEDETFSTTLKINGALISKLDGYNVVRYNVNIIPSRDFAVNKLHEIEIDYAHGGAENGSAGVVFVLIYRTP
jgi:hypothetical protein